MDYQLPRLFMMYFNMSAQNTTTLNLEIIELFRGSCDAALALLSRGCILGQLPSEREESGSSGDVFSERFRNIETLLNLMLAQRTTLYQLPEEYCLHPQSGSSPRYSTVFAQWRIE